jgi:beta-glucosidase-like glycosyl hydrolase
LLYTYEMYERRFFLILLLISFGQFTRASLPKSMCDHLKSTNQLEVEKKVCVEIESKIGQLIYMRVDSYGTDKGVHPYYQRLIKRIQPGAILYYGKHEIVKKRNAIKKMQKNSHLPLIIGSDFSLNSFGAAFDNQCARETLEKRLLIHKAKGENSVLGPGAESEGWYQVFKSPEDIEVIYKEFEQFGIDTAAKHYPYTEQDKYNLHVTFQDTKIKSEKAKEKLVYFKELNNRSGLIMTTHMFSSEIDPLNIVTHSKKWIKILRDDVGFRGLIITDATDMVDDYTNEKKFLGQNWIIPPSLKIHSESYVPLRAILSGHDMILSQYAAREVEYIYKDLMTLAAQQNSLGRELRARIKNSYKRIARYKKNNFERLSHMPELTDEDMNIIKGIEERTYESGCIPLKENERKVVEKLHSPGRVKLDLIEENLDLVEKSSLSKISQKILAKEISLNQLSPESFALALLEHNQDIISQVVSYLEENIESKEKVFHYAQNLLRDKEVEKAHLLFAQIKKWPKGLINQYFLDHRINIIKNLVTIYQTHYVPPVTLDIENVDTFLKTADLKKKEMALLVEYIFPEEEDLLKHGLDRFLQLSISPLQKIRALINLEVLGKHTQEGLEFLIQQLPQYHSQDFSYEDEGIVDDETLIEYLIEVVNSRVLTRLERSELSELIKINAVERLSRFKLGFVKLNISPIQKNLDHFVNSFISLTDKDLTKLSFEGKYIFQSIIDYKLFSQISPEQRRKLVKKVSAMEKVKKFYLRHSEEFKNFTKYLNKLTR